MKNKIENENKILWLCETDIAIYCSDAEEMHCVTLSGVVYVVKLVYAVLFPFFWCW